MISVIARGGMVTTLNFVLPKVITVSQNVTQFVCQYKECFFNNGFIFGVI